MAENQNRCWPGYEPVKGRKPHSQGSCRPKAESKLSGSEQKFRAKRKEQLDEWKSEHPKTKRSASQHLHAPGTETKKAAQKKAAQKKAAEKKAAKKKPTKKATAQKSNAAAKGTAHKRTTGKKRATSSRQPKRTRAARSS